MKKLAAGLSGGRTVGPSESTWAVTSLVGEGTGDGDVDYSERAARLKQLIADSLKEMADDSKVISDEAKAKFQSSTVADVKEVVIEAKRDISLKGRSKERIREFSSYPNFIWTSELKKNNYVRLGEALDIFTLDEVYDLFEIPELILKVSMKVPSGRIVTFDTSYTSKGGEKVPAGAYVDLKNALILSPSLKGFDATGYSRTDFKDPTDLHIVSYVRDCPAPRRMPMAVVREAVAKKIIPHPGKWSEVVITDDGYCMDPTIVRAAVEGMKGTAFGSSYKLQAATERLKATADPREGLQAMADLADVITKIDTNAYNKTLRAMQSLA